MTRFLSCVLGLVWLSTTSRADVAAVGFSAVDLPSVPSLLSVTLDDGTWVGFGSSSVGLYAADGSLLELLHSFPDVVPAEGIGVDPTQSFAVVSRSDGPRGGT